MKATEKNLDNQLSQIIVEHEPVQIFVGRPALLSGADGTASEKARLFAVRLRAITDIPIHLVDERMSTISAARNLRDSGKTAKDSKNSIDMAAAVAILEFALDLEKRK